MATVSLAAYFHQSPNVAITGGGRCVSITTGQAIITLCREEAAQLAADLCEALGAHSLEIADNALPAPLAAAVTHGSRA